MFWNIYTCCEMAIPSLLINTCTTPNVIILVFNIFQEYNILCWTLITCNESLEYLQLVGISSKDLSYNMVTKVHNNIFYSSATVTVYPLNNISPAPTLPATQPLVTTILWSKCLNVYKSNISLQVIISVECVPCLAYD